MSWAEYFIFERRLVLFEKETERITFQSSTCWAVDYFIENCIVAMYYLCALLEPRRTWCLLDYDLVHSKVSTSTNNFEPWFLVIHWDLMIYMILTYVKIPSLFLSILKKYQLINPKFWVSFPSHYSAKSIHSLKRLMKRILYYLFCKWIFYF